MDDPLPPNIDGRKVQTVSHEFSHNVEHRIPWGQVALGVGGLALALVLYKMFVVNSEEDEEPIDVDGFEGPEEIEDAASIAVGGGGGLAR